MSLSLENLLEHPVNLIAVIISVAVLIAGLAYALLSPRMMVLALKNLRRNLVRTLLTGLAIAVFVMMITLMWSVMFFLDTSMQAKSADFKLIVMERWKVPSMMPATHADYLNPASSKCLQEIREAGLGPQDFMTWSFYGGFPNPEKKTLDTMVFFFTMDANAIRPMMDDLDDYDPALVKKLANKIDGCLMGREKMRALDKRIGERFKITSMNYKGIDLDFEIVGELPTGRYDKSAIMNESYFAAALEKYAREHGGARHPLDQMRLNLIWLRVRDQATFDKVGKAIEDSPFFSDRPVKCETSSSAVGSFMAPFRDIFFFVKFGLVPAILISMALVIANAISISVRERRAEIAVLKVLGYRPNQILCLVLAECLFVGSVCGLVSASLAFAYTQIFGGIQLPISFFSTFPVPAWAFFWGLAMGAGTAFLGSFMPAWTARSIRVSEVFAKVA